MATTPITMRQVLLDPMVERALATTAQMFGVSQAAVATIVRSGLPMMANLAKFNPELLKCMYAATRSELPEPVVAYYDRMALNPSVRQSAVDDYKATFGSMLDAVHRETARQAGITDGQARDVMAAILPAVNHALVLTVNLDDEQSFAEQLKDLSA